MRRTPERDTALRQTNERYARSDHGTPAVVEIVGITVILTIILVAAVLVLQGAQAVLR